MPSMQQHFIDAQELVARQVPVRQAPLHHSTHAAEHLFPGSVKEASHFQPGEPLRPSGQELHVAPGEGLFPLRPRPPSHFHSTSSTLYPRRSVQVTHGNPPLGLKLELTPQQRVVPWSRFPTPRTDGTAVSSCPHFRLQRTLSRVSAPYSRKDKRLVVFDLIENALDAHPGLSRLGV
jgi:hypothetical protein